jgi:hypothetical protein
MRDGPVLPDAKTGDRIGPERSAAVRDGKFPEDAYGQTGAANGRVRKVDQDSRGPTAHVPRAHDRAVGRSAVYRVRRDIGLKGQGSSGSTVPVRKVAVRSADALRAPAEAPRAQAEIVLPAAR